MFSQTADCTLTMDPSNNNLKRSSEGEIAFRDWHFVDRSDEQESDDDSIEVIEREVPTPLLSISGSDLEESSNEEYFKDFGNDVNELDLMNTVNERDFPESPIRTIVPPNKKCRSCSSSSNKLNGKKIISNSVTSKVLYSFILGVLASLTFQKCKSAIPNEISSFSLDRSFMISDLFNSWFRDECIYYPWRKGISRGCVQESFEEKKIILNDILTKQLNLSMYARHLVEDIYALNISELAPQLIREEDLINHLNFKKRILPCKDNITDEQLPMICVNDHVFFVYIEGKHLISAHHTILQFFYDIEKRANSLRDNILISLTESNLSGKSTSDSGPNNFVHDCDHLSKPFKCIAKPLIYEEKRDTDGRQSWHDEVSKLSRDEKRKYSDGSLISEAASKAQTKFILYDKPADTKINCGLCQTLATVIEEELTKEVEKVTGKITSKGQMELEKFLKSCYPCKTIGNSLESALPTGEISADENKPIKFIGKEKKNPISGEWLFDLYKARAKLRSYYDNIVSGDWLFKLGRARDRLRNDKNKDNRRYGDYKKFEEVRKEYQGQYWYKKNMEKLKLKFKYVLRQLKDTKEIIANKFKELKIKLKNRFRE